MDVGVDRASASTTLEEPTTTAPARRVARPIRADIDGLRAVAILLVVLYHARVPGFDAGFIGVDVFFVISGFLIIGQLESEVERRGTIRLADFWARRARRLLPAATLVIVLVAVASPFLFPVYRWKDIAGEVLAAALYASNELYRSRAVDYFAGDITASPLLNMWSLAVEEQFYVFWPLALVLLGWVTSRRGRASFDAGRRRRLVLVAFVVALSFVLCLSLTEGNPAGAYYRSVSRVWEFGVGAILAMVVARLSRLTPTQSRPLLAGGAVLLVVGAVVIPGLPFPGSAALLPVLGTAALIAAGTGPDPLPARLLGWGPLQAIGRISYSWYLWHWPILILGLRWRPDTSVWWSTALVAASLAPAWVARRFVEAPLRTRPDLVSSNRRTLAVMVGLVVISLLAGGVLWWRADQQLQDPFLARVEAARVDYPPLPNECTTTDVNVLREQCVWGDRTADRTVLLLGDSHAGHWLPAADAAGQARGFKVIASMQGNCPAIPIARTEQLPSCTARQEGLPAMVRGLDPDLVVLADSSGYLGKLVDANGDLVPADGQVAAWRDATRTRARELAQAGIPLLVVLDNPRFTDNPVDCLMAEGRGEPCAISRAVVDAALADAHAAERAAVDEAGQGHVYDPVPDVCSDTACPAVDGELIVYGDRSHFTPAFARTLAGPFGAAIEAALSR